MNSLTLLLFLSLPYTFAFWGGALENIQNTLQKPYYLAQGVAQSVIYTDVTVSPAMLENCHTVTEEQITLYLNEEELRAEGAM